MIFTACASCDSGLVVSYEAGDHGAGLFDRVICDQCGAPNYVQLVSFAGETLSEAEAVKRGLVKAPAEDQP